MQLRKIGSHTLLGIAVILTMFGSYQIFLETSSKSAGDWIWAKEAVPGQIQCIFAGIAGGCRTYFNLQDMLPQNRSALIDKFSNKEAHRNLLGAAALFSALLFAAYIIGDNNSTSFRRSLDKMPIGVFLNLFSGFLMEYIFGALVFSELVRRIKS